MSFIGDVFFGGAEREAARRQQEAARQGQELVAQQFQQTQDLLQPFISAGATGLTGLQSEIADLSPEAQRQADAEFAQQFQESPGVQFLREQGLRGVEGTAAALGGLGGGQRLKELTRVSQGLALQDFGRQQARRDALNAARRGLVGQQVATGLGAGTSLGGFGTQQAAQQAQLLGQLGQAQAAEETAGARAFQNILGQGLGLAASGVLPGIGGFFGGLFGGGGPGPAGLGGATNGGALFGGTGLGR